MRSLQRATGITAVVTNVALIAAACVSGAGGASGDGAAAAGGDDTIAFAAPLDGSTVSIPFAVAIDSSVTLADPDAGVREDAAKAVAKLGDCWPVPTLLARLESEGEAPVKDEIQKALEAISGRSKKEYEGLAKWKVWWSVEQDIFVKRK